MSEALLETYRGSVYPWHCDHMGHMNVMWYVGKFDEATWSLFAHIGLTAQAMREQGLGMAAVQQNITYRRELLAGDTVAVRSAFLELKAKTARFVHEMRNASSGEVSAICVLTAVQLDTRARKARPLPEEFLAPARALVRPYTIPPA